MHLHHVVLVVASKRLVRHTLTAPRPTGDAAKAVPQYEEQGSLRYTMEQKPKTRMWGFEPLRRESPPLVSDSSFSRSDNHPYAPETGIL